MARTITYTHSGTCPYVEGIHSIHVNYTEVNMVGRSSPGYKKISYSCELSNECPYPGRDQFGRCPVFMSSPDKPY